MLNKLGGRKMMVTMLCLAAGVAIDLTTQRGLSQNLLYLMLGIIGIYTTGNVATKVTGKKEKPDTAPLDEIQERQAQLEQYISGVTVQVEDVQRQVSAANKRVAALLGVTTDT